MAVATRLLTALQARDHELLRSCFAPDAQLRALTPHALREEQGVDAIEARYAAWLDRLEPFRVLAADAERVADRVRIRYRFLGLDPEHGWQENEHTGYATVADGLVTALNVSCAGFRPSEAR